MNKQMKNHTHQILNSGHPNFDYWMTKWLNVYLGLASPALAYIQLRQRTNVQTLHKASHSCKQMQNYTLSILQFLSCKHVCIYTFMTPFTAWLEKCNLCQRCGSASDPGRVYSHPEMNESNVALTSCSSVSVPHFELNSTQTYLQQHEHASCMPTFFFWRSHVTHMDMTKFEATCPQSTMYAEVIEELQLISVQS